MRSAQFKTWMSIGVTLSISIFVMPILAAVEHLNYINSLAKFHIVLSLRSAILDFLLK